MTYTKTLFDEIKNSYNNDNKGESSFKDIMKFESGNTYTVRLIPNIAEPRKTIYHYYHHSWTSKSTRQFVTTLCPSTYGEKCPIDDYVLKIYRNGSDSEKEANKPISRKENWMVNVYVINDPVNGENNGKVKVVRYGKELDKIIQAAISGDDAEDFGAGVFDLQNGCTLKIKCESRSSKGDGKTKFTTYSSSKFVSASKLEEITDEKLQEIYANLIDLSKFNRRKTTAELQRMIDEHFFCIVDTNNKESSSSEEEKEETPVANSVKESSTDFETATVDDTTDAKLKALLDGLT